MSHQVLARKWRPRRFEEMVGQEHVLRMLTNALNNQRLHHAYLFTGTRGVGKTSLGRILAKCLNCETGISASPCLTCPTCLAIEAGKFFDLIEVDAASRTKVEDTRELLENVQYAANQGRYKIYLIDETHMLSTHSFNALLKTLEEPPPHVIFILATTDPKRLPITILSRCLQFNLKRVPVEQIAHQLQFICEQEKISCETSALTLLAKAADGSMRDALSVLDQAIAFCHDNITEADTREMLGSIEQDAIFRLLQALFAHDGKKLLDEIAELANQTPNFNQVLEELLSTLHQISVAQIVPSHATDSVAQLATLASPEEIQLFYQIALIGRRDLPLTPTPLHGFEMVMLRMLAFKPAAKPSTIPTEIENKMPLSWPQLLTQLNLSGLSYSLAANCSLQRMTEQQVELALSANHEPMLNKKLIDRIEQALSEHFKKPMQLTIQITRNEINTPLKEEQQAQAAKLASATDSIKNDDSVQKILNVFGATLDTDSIKAID